MKKLVTIVSALIGIYGSLTAAETTLCINEIMQSNVDNYMLEHDFPDSWVELYNPTSADIDIYQYYLGASSSAAGCYRFTTHATISKNGYLLIPCDKLGSKLHTNFNLESEAGTLYLFNSSGTKIATLSYPAMPAPNIAYGRSTDGGSTWGWEINPTPGKSNDGSISETILPAPVFSKAGQVMSAATTITISIPSGTLPADTKIYATTDGTEPTYNSTSGTKLTFDIAASTVIRAKLLSKSAVARPSTTNSYIFHPRKTALPIISLVSNNDYLYSSAEGILSSNKTNGKENYKYDWRRPVNAEYLGVKGEKAWFNQGGEVAVGGAVSRFFAQKTIKLYAKKRFGTKKLKGQFWKDKPKVTKVKSFALRNGGNSSAAMRFNDALLQRTFGTHLTNVDYQAYSPAIVYINGKYYGVVGLRERSNEDYVEANFDGLENIEMATQESYKKTDTERRHTSFSEVYKLYTSSSSTYNQLAAKIDVDNFMKALMAEIYAANSDWPHNNISMWRDKSTNGKWRWILKDLDFYIVGENSKFNMFKYLFGPVTTADQEYETATRSTTIQCALLYKKMMSFPEFREKFIDSYTTYLGDFLKPSLNKAIIDEFYKEIEAEMKPTFDTFNYNYPELANWMTYFRMSHQERSRYVYQHMAAHFSLGNVIPMSINPSGATVTINGIGLTTGSFDGAYYSKRKLNLNSGSGQRGWKMTTYKKDGSKMVKNQEKTFTQAELSLQLSDYSNCDSVAFTTYIANETDFTKKLASLGIKVGGPTDWSAKTAIAIKEPSYAYADISGISALPTGKNSDLHAYIDFYDNAGNYFRKKILLNLQGSTSNPKVNLSVSFCEDDWIGEETPDITFGNWVAQDEFHLKAFYEDGMRGTAEIAYQLYSKITQRSNGYPKAFPLSLYINGTYYGVMSWQIKKQRANMGLDGKTATNVWLDGTLNDKQLFQNSINWAKFQVRNPKDLYNQDGSLYDGDNPQEIMGTNSKYYDSGTTKMVRTAQAKKYIQKMSAYCTELATLESKGTNKATMQTEIKKRFDTQELINYMVFSLVTNNYDGFSQNWQWFTTDGTKWSVAPYDCNLTFGYNEEGTSLWPATQSSKKYDYRMENADSSGPMYWIKNYFWDEVKSRYATLRKNGTISSNSIMTLVNNWYNRIGSANYKEEWAKWKSSPCVTSFKDSPDRFKEWIDYRLALEDAYLGYSTSSSSYTITVGSCEWATVCVPFSFSIPSGMKVYTVKAINADGINLELEATTTPSANKPYLVHAKAGNYTISGELASASGALTNGVLTGTLINTYAPAKSYVLQDLNNVVGFYHVSTEDTMPISAYHAYLTTSSSSKLGHFRIPENISGISEVTTDDEGEQILYNIWGQQTNESNQSGLIIQRSADGSHRKIYIQK